MTDRTIQERIQQVAETTVLTALPDSSVMSVAVTRTGTPLRWMVSVDGVDANGTKIRFSGYGFDTGTLVAVDLDPVNIPDPFADLLPSMTPVFEPDDFDGTDIDTMRDAEEETRSA